MAKPYGVGDLLTKCDDHVVESNEFSLADKFALADELNNNKLFVSLL